MADYGNIFYDAAYSNDTHHSAPLNVKKIQQKEGLVAKLFTKLGNFFRSIAPVQEAKH